MLRRHFIQAGAGAYLVGNASSARAADMSARRLKVVAIGHSGRGDFGHDLVRPWGQLPETDLVAIADPEPQGLAKQQARIKVARGFSDYRKMLAEVQPDIVVV